MRSIKEKVSTTVLEIRERRKKNNFLDLSRQKEGKLLLGCCQKHLCQPAHQRKNVLASFAASL